VPEVNFWDLLWQYFYQASNVEPQCWVICAPKLLLQLETAERGCGSQTCSNKDQSNLAKGGITLASPPTPHLYSLGGSIVLMIWLQCAIAYFHCGFDPKSPLSLAVMDPHRTVCRWTLQVYLPNGI